MATSGTMFNATASSGATTGNPARPVGRGGWVYLPADFARQHPLYGAYGWAWLLILFLFLGPVAMLLQDYRLLTGLALRPELFWVVFALEAIFGVLCWITGFRLGRERSNFTALFMLTAALGIVCAVLFFAVLVDGLPRDYEDRAMFGFLWRAVPILVWTIYVVRSKRINVTIRHRVTNRDPFLRSQWLSDETPAGGVSQARRRSLFARPVRKVTIVPSRSAAVTPEELATAGPREGAVRESGAIREEVVPELAPRSEFSSRSELGRSELGRSEFASERSPRRVADREDELAAGAAEPAPVAGTASARPIRPTVRRAGTQQVLDRFYVPRRSVSGALPMVEPIVARQPEATIHPPEAPRRQRLESALIVDRLRRLQIAHEEGLIGEQEMRAKRAELLREL